jgi:hypothetical protein
MPTAPADAEHAVEAAVDDADTALAPPDAEWADNPINETATPPKNPENILNCMKFSHRFLIRRS